MNLKKKIIKLLGVSLLISALSATTGYAEGASDIWAENGEEIIQATEAEDVGFRSLNLNSIEKDEAETLADTSSNIEAMSIPYDVEMPLQTRDMGSTDAPVFHVNGNLDEAYDIYVTSLSE